MRQIPLDPPPVNAMNLVAAEEAIQQVNDEEPGALPQVDAVALAAEVAASQLLQQQLQDDGGISLVLKNFSRIGEPHHVDCA